MTDMRSELEALADELDQPSTGYIADKIRAILAKYPAPVPVAGLLPCPFCGCTSILDSDPGSGDSVYCEECGVMLPREEWNCRAAPAQTEEVGND